jgi:hypothetical protein
MARRPEYQPPKDVMNSEELSEMKRRLSMLSQQHVEDFYRKVTYGQCSIDCGSVPKARAIQELVTAWKLLRQWKRGG